MSVSRLQETLDAGKFAVTAEIGPPRSCETERLREMARMLKGTIYFNKLSNPEDFQVAVICRHQTTDCCMDFAT